MSIKGKILTLSYRLRKARRVTSDSFYRLSAKATRSGFALSRYHRDLLALRGKFEGRTCFMVGNGPSVRFADLDSLKSEISFCFNRFYLAYGKTDFRPTFYLSSDRQMIADFGVEMVRVNDCPVFFSSSRVPRMKEQFLWFPNGNWPLQFQTWPFDGVCAGGTSPVAAIQLAYFLGMRHIYLYGVDHTVRNVQKVEGVTDVYRSYKGEGNHFLNNYYAGKCFLPPDMMMVEEAYAVCDEFLRAQGGWIKNATRNTYLPKIERVDFDAIGLPTRTLKH